jgi:hypothetical protein
VIIIHRVFTAEQRIMHGVLIENIAYNILFLQEIEDLSTGQCGANNNNK